jgi:hypothetical protein
LTRWASIGKIDADAASGGDGSFDGGEASFVTGSTAAVVAGSVTLTGSRGTLLALFSPSWLSRSKI